VTDLDERERAVLAAEAAWRAERDAAREAAKPPPLTVSQVAIGWTICSATRRAAGDEGWVGGVVVDVRDGGRYVTDDGEIVDVPRSFRVLDPYPPAGLRFEVLEESDVAPDSIEAPEPFRLHLLISRLAAELVSHGSTRRSLLSHAEERLRLCAHVHHLAGATRLEHSIVTMGGHP